MLWGVTTADEVPYSAMHPDQHAPAHSRQPYPRQVVQSISDAIGAGRHTEVMPAAVTDSLGLHALDEGHSAEQPE